MKKLFYLLTLVCACVSFTGCEDDEVRLTINTSAYDVVNNLKDANGNLYFTGNLEDGLQIRVSYLVLKQSENNKGVSIVESNTRYVNNIQDIASYTTEILEPGVYSVIVTSDFVKGDTEFNTVTVNEQYKGLKVSCAQSAGVYNAFGTGYMKDISVDGETEVTVNTARKGGLVTFLLKNTDKMTDKSYRLSLEKFEYSSYGTNGDDFNNNTKGIVHQWDDATSSIQHYSASMGYITNPLSLSWQAGYFDIRLNNGEDKVVELDFETNTAVLK